MFTFFQLSLILLLNNVLCAPVPVLHTETTETQNIVTQYESVSGYSFFKRKNIKI